MVTAGLKFSFSASEEEEKEESGPKTVIMSFYDFRAGRSNFICPSWGHSVLASDRKISKIFESSKIYR